MVGHIEDNGIFFGLMKLAGDGGTPYALIFPGIEKSSIPSFRMIPVRGETILHPNLPINNKIIFVDHFSRGKKFDLQSVNSSGCSNCIAIWCNDVNMRRSMVIL